MSLWRRAARAAGLALLAFTLAAPGAQAQEPERVRELVYHVNAFQGAGWHGALYPASEDTVYLLAGQTSTLTPRHTMVYYWPITQRYVPDWAKLDELVEGRLEIRARGRVVETLELADYVLQDPAGASDSELSLLYLGEEARQRFADYQAQLDAYWADLEAYLAAQRAGQEGDAPEFPRRFSTMVLKGFAVNLPPGAYQARLLDAAGAALPGGEKRLVVFTPRRTGIGYQIVPEARWTAPEGSATPADTIYVAGEARLFLQPYEQAEYNAYLYGKLLDPQAPPADRGAWHWAPVRALSGVTLRYSAGGAVVDSESEGFLVRQLGGGGLGYTIEPFAPGAGRSAPSFTGHEVRLNLAPRASEHLYLFDAAGNPIAGSERKVRALAAPTGWRIFAPAALPLLAAAGLVWTRRRPAPPD